MSTLELSKDSFKATRKFYDDRNYPRGISRSGDFTIAEVQIIENYGVTLRALAMGTQTPINDVEQHFVEVCQGKCEAQTAIERAWLKYQSKTMSPKQFHTLFGRNKIESNGEEIVSDDLEDDD